MENHCDQSNPVVPHPAASSSQQNNTDSQTPTDPRLHTHRGIQMENHCDQSNPVAPHSATNTPETHTPSCVNTTTTSHHTSGGTSVTHIQFVNVGQVINVSGEGNTVHVPESKILMYQQAVGVNPTIGVANYPPPGDHPHHFATPPNPYGFSSASGVVAPAIQDCVTYAEGPPEGIELVELTQKLMVMKDNWVILGQYLETPDHELAATDVEERTLYRKVNRTLRNWIDTNEYNDRQTFVSKLPHDLARLVHGVLRKS